MNRTLRPTRPLVISAVVVVLALGLAACGGDTDGSDSPSSDTSPSGPDAAVERVELDPTEGVSYPETPASDAPVVEIYSDFQCPICQVFADTYLGSLRDAADAGKINLVLHQFSFLDRVSRNEYSSRSANAATCVYVEGGSTAYLDYYEALFENQPAEGTAGPEDDELVDLAATVGVTGIDDCVTGGAYDDYVEDAADAAQDADVNGTPTVIVDGEVADLANLESVIRDLTA
ncbi:DsbA family protein [Aeromicrobium sp. Sec7.5]|uniref:DsbA family protein n=1 Tax=Aeromicrobium sp. Sec7.5 TaxID=3121276 RepID=UPI002FE4EDB3